MNKLPLRDNVCIVLLSSERKLFIAERSDAPGTWQFPQGGVEKEFSEIENAYKELEEETSIKRESVIFKRVLNFINEYEFQDPPKYFKGKFRGQRQRYYVFEFSGEESEINVQEVSLPEFRDWKWVTSDELFVCADPVRLHAYKKVIEELRADCLM